MDFAKAHLEKHGWSQGSGLGREETGIKEAIKVTLKFDSAGVGHKAGDEFTHQWWNHLYNKAANNITVENGKSEVTLVQNEEFVITKNKPLPKGLGRKDLLYGMFVKANTLNSGIEVTDQKQEASESEEEEISTPLSALTDEELFKICGGRTAHKGARHGLHLSGKLARLKQQEELSGLCVSDVEIKKKHKKEKKNELKRKFSTCGTLEKQSCKDSKYEKEIKSNKSKNESHLDVEMSVENQEVFSVRKKNKKHSKLLEDIPKCKRKKKKKANISDKEAKNYDIECNVTVNDIHLIQKKKKKKKRIKEVVEQNPSDIPNRKKTKK